MSLVDDEYLERSENKNALPSSESSIKVRGVAEALEMSNKMFFIY